MARRCPITNKGVQSGNNVSHAKNRTRRRFLPNIQVVSMHSVVLGKSLQLRASTSGLRTVEHRGGLDAFLMSTSRTKLSPEFARLKQLVESKVAATAALDAS